MQCTPQAAATIGTNRNGNNNAQQFTANANTGAAAQARAASQAATQSAAQRKQQAAQNINNTVNATPNPNPIPGSPVPGVKNAAAGFARSVIQAGYQRVADALDAAMAWARDATVGRASWYLNTVAGLTKHFVRSSNDIVRWLQVHAGSEGRSAGENLGVAHFNDIAPNTTGRLKKWQMELIDPWLKNLQPIASRIGLTLAEFKELVGHWTIYEHMPERNAELLARWQQGIADELAKGPNANHSLIRKYQTNIGELSKHIDDVNPVRADGTRYVSGGYTNGEARAKMAQILKDYNVTANEMSALAAQLRDIYAAVQGDRAAEGFIAENVYNMFPNWKLYAPVRTVRENITGATNDAGIYNPSRLRAMEGSRATDIADAATTIERFMQRAAYEHGYRPFGLDLIALNYKAKQTQIDNGVRVYDYNRVTNMASSGDVAMQNLINGTNGFAMVVELPLGNGQFAKKLITFDPRWQDTRGTGLLGTDLNRAFNLTEKHNLIVSAMADMTSLRAQTFTRFNPAFAPINAIRDSWERFTHLAGASYVLENGTRVDGSTMLLSYMANLPRASEMLLGVMSGRIDPNNTAVGRIWKEYVDSGLRQEYTPGRDRVNQTKLAEALNPQDRTWQQKLLTNPQLKGFSRALVRLSEGNAGKVLKSLDAWNDYFNNLASFNHYLTLRENGVRQSSASSGVLQMMNLYESGTTTGVLRTMFPFIKPTAQSAAAMFRTFGLATNARGEFRPNLRGIAMFGGQLLAFGLLKPVLEAQLGQDSEGRSYYDMIPLDSLQRFLPVGIGDGQYIKLPLGFGPMQLAATLANVKDRMEKGQMSAGDGFIETMMALARNITPAEWPTFAAKEDPVKWLGTLLSPHIFQPIVQAGMNVAYGGRPLTYETPGGAEPMALRGRKSTEAVYHRLARSLYQATGFDLAPEQLKHVMEGYLTGPLRLFSEFMKEDSLRAAGIDKTNAQILGPWMSAVGASIMHGKVANTTNIQFYNEWNKVQKQVRDLGIKITDSSYGSNRDKRIEYQTQKMLEAGLDSATIERYFTLQRATERVAQESRKLKEAGLDGHWFDENNKDVMVGAFEDYAKKREEYYLDALRQAGLL